MEALEKMVATLNGRKRLRVTLSSIEQRKIVRLLSRSPSNRQQKSIEMCRKLLDYGLLNNSAAPQLVNFLTSVNSVDGLLSLMDRTTDLSESCLVKILSFAIVGENGTKPSVVNAERIPLILRILRYSYSPSSLTQELKIFSTEHVLPMLRVLNCLFAQSMVARNHNDTAPTLDQVVDFMNCLLDASSRSVLNVPEFEKEINYASALVDCSVKSLSVLAESELRRKSSSSGASGSKHKDYSIQVLVFNA